MINIRTAIRSILVVLIGCSSALVADASPDGSSSERNEAGERHQRHTTPDSKRTKPGSSEQNPKQERYNTGWSIYLDNDLVAYGNQDDRYTGGMAVSLSGRRATEYFFSLDPVLGFLNNLTGFSSLGGEDAFTRHSIEIGGTAFTPENVEATEPLPDQHPYSSLLFLNNSRKTVNKKKEFAYFSTFSIGVFGLDAVGEVQNAIHDLTGSDEANGWGNQISDGGEPTAFYSLARQDLLAIHRSGPVDYDLRSMFGGSVGTVTQVGAGLDVRIGRISSSPWRFNANYEEFINLGMPISEDEEPGKEQLNDFFGWASVQARVRGYNAALEGQFRDSPVTFDRGELRTVLGTAAAGITWEFQHRSRITVSLRGRTSEIRDSDEFFPMWGALIFSRSY